MKKTLILLLVLVVIVSVFYVFRARGARARVEAAAVPLFVPIIVSPSVQPVKDQALLLSVSET